MTAETGRMRVDVPRLLFIVGCPRSGTTWMQLLFAQHRQVATAPETQVFAYYIDHMLRQWQHEVAGLERAQGKAGLSRLLNEAEFEQMCRSAAQVVIDKIASSNPSASVVLEKSPKHALSADFIQRVFPDAFFLNVIRDPRDSVASLLAAGRSWGGGWAPKSAVAASRLWLDSLAGARRASEPASQYREVRYESLRADPIPELMGLFSWLGIDTSAENCAAMVAACDLKTLQKAGSATGMPVPAARSPSGFFRKGVVGGWSSDLTASEAHVVEYICGDAMTDLGYARAGTSRFAPVRIALYDGLQRFRESVDWQLQRLIQHI